MARRRIVPIGKHRNWNEDEMSNDEKKERWTEKTLNGLKTWGLGFILLSVGIAVFSIIGRFAVINGLEGGFDSTAQGAFVGYPMLGFIVCFILFIILFICKAIFFEFPSWLGKGILTGDWEIE